MGTEVSPELLARVSGLFLMRVTEPTTLRVVGGVLEIGPGVSPGAIATLGVRRILKAQGIDDEREVRMLVETYGYEYVPQGSCTQLAAIVIRPGA